jgi:uncharacterized membrane protein YfcA
MVWVEIAAIGLAVGFLAGMFGKGGSAVATPLLVAAGLHPLIALAAPLPATIPTTLAGASAYRDAGGPDRSTFVWSLAFGIPATALGALATRWIGGEDLVRATDVLIALLGIRILVRSLGGTSPGWTVAHTGPRLALVATSVGLVSGLLANSGGFLLAPLYMLALHMPVKRAFATSLAVAAVLALPGTLVHWALGHIEWSVVVVFAAASVPMAYLGARLAVRTGARHLERIYGIGLTVLGPAFLLWSFK